MNPRDPYRYFRVEARELLDGLRRGVVALERRPAQADCLPTLLRHAHTLKGAARVVRLTAVSDLAHQMEDILVPCRDTGAPPSSAQFQELSRLLAAIAAGLDRIDMPAVPAPDATPQTVAAGGAGDGDAESVERAAASRAALPGTAAALLDTVRLQVAEVDAVLADVADTAWELAGLRGDVRGFQQTMQQARLLHALAGRSRLRAAGDGEMSARLHTDAGDLAAGLDGVRQRVASRVERLGRGISRLHEQTGRLRLIPVDPLWSFLDRAVRDAAQTLGRRVRLEIENRTRRLDAPVFAALQESLLHLVRNAVSHGMEPAAERAASGKAGEGRIVVRVEHRCGRLRVVCEDDGRGVDVTAVARGALARGWIEPAAASRLDMPGAIALLSRGGFSTAQGAGEISGRGVGLEAARAALAQVGGELSLESTPSAGTTATLVVPLSLSAVDVLCVESAGQPLLLPLDAIRRVLRAEASAVRRSGPREELHHDGRALPYVSLHRLLPAGLTAARPARRHVTVAVIEGASGTVAVGVDRISGVVEAVVRPVPALAAVAPYVAGASSGAEGKPRLVLDADALTAAVLGIDAEAAGAPGVRPRLLVVDDSLTTRMLEQSILESAGYVVDTAVSAEDALLRLREQRYGLLLVDVEMPGMDGFGLIAHLRCDPLWRDLPAILVTSRESREDRQRGLAAGAQDYVVKGEFDQRRLLRRIEELLA